MFRKWFKIIWRQKNAFILKANVRSTNNSQLYTINLQTDIQALNVMLHNLED
jgi:hypothetical protein